MNTHHSMRLHRSVEHLCGYGEGQFCHEGLKFESDRSSFPASATDFLCKIR